MLKIFLNENKLKKNFSCQCLFLSTWIIQKIKFKKDTASNSTTYQLVVIYRSLSLGLFSVYNSVCVCVCVCVCVKGFVGGEAFFFTELKIT